ncbi:MAG: rRNA pseudouridine synthase [Prevotella sp.]|nr:rRNA pseudouridine synthase [Candidatus Prevotella equi]
METENTSMQEQDSANVNNEFTREGNGYQPRQPRQRVRISSQRASYGDRPQYGDRSHNYNRNSEGGFRPEGFGAGLSQDNERPSRGGYQSRGGYGQQRGGYGQRGSYGQQNNYGQQGGYNRPYRPYNSDQQSMDSNQEDGYQPNNYGQRGGYGQQRGGYGQQRGGYGQQRGGYGQQRGGYGQQRGGYGQQRSGYGQQRGGYGQQRGGGYGQQRGGYGQRQHTSGYDPNAKYSMKKRIEYNENNIDPTAPVRLNKFLANAGVCSRREADDFIEAGVVTVNGQIVTELGTKIMRTDEVKFHDQPVTLEKKVYVLLNKPKDYVTTSDDPQQRKTVMDLVQGACPERIYPVGRLDRNTTGVLLLTNDGDLASKLTHPKFLKKKVYHVYLDKNVTAHDLQQIAEGITLDDGEIRADAIEYAHATDKKQVGIEIHSGKNRIVRRIFESLGYRVIKLDRVQFAGLTKKNLRRGDWRFLTEKEVDMLRMGAFE